MKKPKILEIKEAPEQISQMRKDLSIALKAYMKKEKLGYNDLVKRLNSNSAQISKILSERGNVTLKTIGNIAHFIGKKARIMFK